MILSAPVKSDHNSARYAQSHVQAWEKTLAMRISLQHVIDQLNQLPVLEEISFKTDDISDIHNNELKKNLRGVLGQLVGLLDSQSDDSTSLKRKSSSLTEDITWEDVLASQKALEPKWQSVVNKWHARTHYGSEQKKSSLKVFNQTIWDQIDATLSDETRAIEKSCMPTGDSKRRKLSNIPGPLPSSDVGGYDCEVYDDRQFYSLLLKSFISTSSSGGVAAEGSMRKEDLAALRNYKRGKSKVDRKASKGRKIKYVAHEKLKNFMFPMNVESVEKTGSVDVDRLYGSLFQ